MLLIKCINKKYKNGKNLLTLTQGHSLQLNQRKIQIINGKNTNKRRNGEMKKKLFLTVVMTFVFALVLAFAVSAEGVHSNLSTELLQTKVTVLITEDNPGGTEVNLFDSEGNALIWYLDSSGALQSIKAQDERVVYSAASKNTAYLSNVQIDSNGDGTADIPNKNIVVLNLMDDDIGGYGANKVLVETFAYTSGGTKGANLEYAYLRLDTTTIAAKAFWKCPKLKYVNLESLTALTTIGSVSEYNYTECFRECKSLFKGETLDLSKTQLTRISDFSTVPVSYIKFPSTLTTIDSYTFNSSGLISVAVPETITKINGETFQWSLSLTAVYLHSNTTQIWYTAFRQCPELNTIFYVGTKDQFIELLGKFTSYDLVGSNYGPCAFWPVVGANTQSEAKALLEGLKNGTANGNLISYAEYKKLTDEQKSGNKYVVYDYSYCEAYNNGVHTLNATNACVGVCSVCGETVIEHNEKENISVSIEYTSYEKAGVKTTTCNNESCGYSATAEAPALFECLGYSMPENNSDKIVIGYLVNKNAIKEYKEYKESIDKTFKYGVFVVLYDNIKTNDLFDSNGKIFDGAIGVDVSSEYVSFDLRITGFETDEHKSAKLSLGAYVIDGDKISYLQTGELEENAKYTYTTYNDVLAQPKN